MGDRQKGCQGSVGLGYQNYSAVCVSHWHTFEINFWKNKTKPFSSCFDILSWNVMDC